MPMPTMRRPEDTPGAEEGQYIRHGHDRDWPPLPWLTLARYSGHAYSQLHRELPEMAVGETRMFRGPLHRRGTNAGERAWEFAVTRRS